MTGYETCPQCTEIEDNDDILLDEELDAETIAQIEAIQRKWEQDELAACRKVVSQSNRDFKEELQARGIDIVDYCHENDIPLHSPEAEALAARAGYHQTTWNDGRNVERRAKEREKSVRKNAAASRAAVVVASQEKPAKVAPKTEKAPAVVDESDLPAIPHTTNREKLAQWARDYCRALCERYQSERLARKLFGSSLNPGGGSLNWQVEHMPENDEKLMDWACSARLSFDKKIAA